MTNTEPSVPEPFAVVAAFLDGEAGERRRTEAGAFNRGRPRLSRRRARASAVGRRHGPVAFPAPASERRRSMARWAAVAAAIALVASAFGYLAGERAGLSTSVAAAPRTVEAVIDFSEPARAPEPTQVIRLEPGVNWNAAGGN